MTATDGCHRRADGQYANGTPAEVRLFGRTVRMQSGCLEFTGYRNKDGYGSLRYEGQMVKAHRLAYALRVSLIPEGLDVCHRCDNPPCVEPSHLFLGTHADNNRDRAAKGRNNHVCGDSHPGVQRRGETHWSAKLSDADVAEIRRLRDNGWPQQEIADKFNIHAATVSRISRGVWR